MRTSYLDNNATTMLLPCARDAMLAGLGPLYGNPSSKHHLGQAARRALEDARRSVARFIGVPYASEVLFTSSATEAIRHAFQSGAGDASQILVGATDHTAVLDSARQLATASRPCTHLPVSDSGELLLEALTAALAKGKSFVSVTLVNNETGVITDVARVAAICRAHGALLHVDAAQAIGRVEVNVSQLPCDYLSLSPHKFHGPKGVGILFTRRGAPRGRLLAGHQEHGLRGGTENLAGILGAAKALVAHQDWLAHLDHVTSLRDRLEAGILEGIPAARINALEAPRAANTTNIYFPGRNAAELVAELSRQGVYVSAAAACTTGGEPSHVLTAMGHGAERANGSLRFSLSRLTTEDEIELAVSKVVEAYSTTLSVGTREEVDPSTDERRRS